MLLYRCDRCKKEIQNRVVVYTASGSVLDDFKKHWHLDGIPVDMTYDLCEDCVVEFFRQVGEIKEDGHTD